MADQKEISCVYKATTKKGETAHFGEYSAAKAWAGWGSVERIPLTTLTLVEKTKKTCGTCEALARTVMLDQTSHDRHKREWVSLTDGKIDAVTNVQWGGVSGQPLAAHRAYARAIEAELKELNT
jgi:hypothetical protein